MFGVLLVAGVLPVAALAHHLIELPARKAMRRMSGFKRLGGATVAAAPAA